MRVVDERFMVHGIETQIWYGRSRYIHRCL